MKPGKTPESAFLHRNATKVAFLCELSQWVLSCVYSWCMTNDGSERKLLDLSISYIEYKTNQFPKKMISESKGG